MRSNVAVPAPAIYTHEGARAVKVSAYKALRRLVCSALLFEDSFYTKGAKHVTQVSELVKVCEPEQVMALAIECRTKFYLRHMPLFLIRELAKIKGNGKYVDQGLEVVIQRADEMGEYLALYFKDDPNAPLSAGSKRGLQRAFRKFQAYDLAKYDNEKAAFKLRDVIRLVHPTPVAEEQSKMWRQLLNGELKGTADTWEVALSAGADKKETFERLLKERKLGGLAFLRNLRNMIDSGVNEDLIIDRFSHENGFKFVLPFRFVSALRYAPRFVKQMDIAMGRAISSMTPLKGRTGLLIDVSSSMDYKLSQKSELLRVDVAAGLGILVSGLANQSRVFTFSNQLVEIPPFAGLTLIDVIKNSQAHRSTYLGKAMEVLKSETLDRLIIITDEQSHDSLPKNMPFQTYVINVGTEANGVGYGNKIIHIDGFSEQVLNFIQAIEAEEF